MGSVHHTERMHDLNGFLPLTGFYFHVTSSQEVGLFAAQQESARLCVHLPKTPLVSVTTRDWSIFALSLGDLKKSQQYDLAECMAWRIIGKRIWTNSKRYYKLYWCGKKCHSETVESFPRCLISTGDFTAINERYLLLIVP
ncbi:hypothetical protein TNCV_2714151 [Trichonephila clavipes]|nr:hypothetical protein TNCV_2714151 [Trichonephila clavipes]